MRSSTRRIPPGREVAYASTWFPTRAQLWNSLLSVGGFSSTWITFVQAVLNGRISDEEPLGCDIYAESRAVIGGYIPGDTVSVLSSTLLDALTLSGTVVAIDAMGCQKSIAGKVVSKGADFILAGRRLHI